MNVAIRVDASRAIGTGHVRRMLSVAHALRAVGAEVRFLSRSMDIDVSALTAREGFEAILLEPAVGFFEPDSAIPHAAWAKVSQMRDAEETIAALSAIWAPDAVIVDHYSFAADWHREVQGSLGAPLMVIDDLADRSLAGTWLVDHNYHPDHAAKYAKYLTEGMRMLTGPRFAMLGPKYAQAERYRFWPQVRSIGVFLGGVDLDNDSSYVLAALDRLDWSGTVEVVTTSANPHRAELRTLVTNRPRTALTLDLPDLTAFFARHDLQIGAGGGSTWERCCLGAPTICLICAENHRLSVPFLDDIGVLAGYDQLARKHEGPQGLAEVIGRLIEDADRREAMHRAASALVDGRGAARIASVLIGQ